MFFAYVIQSEIDGSLYKGHSEDLQRRLQQHNSGKTKSIKSKIPYILIYSEEFLTREESIPGKPREIEFIVKSDQASVKENL